MASARRAYNAPARALHWLTVALMAAQFVVGYTMDAEGHGRGRGRGRGSGPGRGRGRGGEFDLSDNAMLKLHVALGVTILFVLLVRVLWRRRGLPPWAPTLLRAERTLAHYTERSLLLLQFAIPATGLYLLAVNDDDAVGVHVATHVAFFVVIALHVGLVLKHQFVNRDGLLRRML